MAPKVSGKKNTQYTRRQPQTTAPKKTLAHKGKAMRAQSKADFNRTMADRATLAEQITSNPNPTRTQLTEMQTLAEHCGSAKQGRILSGMEGAIQNSDRGIYDWMLKNINNKGDLDALKQMAAESGTKFSAEQQQLINQWENHFAHPTWTSYANLHGTTYTPPVSGVGAADRAAEAAIAAGEAKTAEVVEIGTKQLTQAAEEVAPAAEKASGLMNGLKKALPWVGGLAAAGIIGYGLYKLFSNSNKQAPIECKVIEGEEAVARLKEQQEKEAKQKENIPAPADSVQSQPVISADTVQTAPVSPKPASVKTRQQAYYEKVQEQFPGRKIHVLGQYDPKDVNEGDYGVLNDSTYKYINGNWKKIHTI